MADPRHDKMPSKDLAKPTYEVKQHYVYRSFSEGNMVQKETDCVYLRASHLLQVSEHPSLKSSPHHHWPQMPS